MKRSVVLITIAGAFAASVANADILLTIDTTNPAAVVISATSGLSAVTASNSSYGLQLFDALSAPAANSGVFGAQSLAGANGGRVQNYVFGFVGTANIGISGPGNQPNNYIAGTQAFVGSWTGNLSFLSFAPAGTIGDIRFYGVNSVDTGIVLGQYQIVPAPGAAAVLGLAGLVATRRRR